MILNYQTLKAKDRTVRNVKESWQSLEKLQNERAQTGSKILVHQMW